MSIQTPELKTKLSDGSILFIDVRKPQELEAGKLSVERFLNIVHTEIRSEFEKSDNDFKSLYGIDKPSKDQKIIVHCQRGGRSKMAQGELIELGYTDVVNWEGGYSSY